MRREMEKHIERLAKRYRETNWESQDVYANYLAQTYYYVAYSTRLLALAAGNMAPQDDRYFRRYIAHIAEESSHEKLARRDLENLGKSLADYPELSETRMLYETQFYKIEHLDPLAFMGYVLLLEAVAVRECPPLTELASRVHGPQSVSFVKLHGEEDPDHVEKALAMLEELEPSRLALAVQNLRQSADCFINMLDAIEERELYGAESQAA